jgi:hypothetical protein
VYREPDLDSAAPFGWHCARIERDPDEIVPLAAPVGQRVWPPP